MYKYLHYQCLFVVHAFSYTGNSCIHVHCISIRVALGANQSPVATSKLLDAPHSHIKGNSVLKACWADMSYNMPGRTPQMCHFKRGRGYCTFLQRQCVPRYIKPHPLLSPPFFLSNLSHQFKLLVLSIMLARMIKHIKINNGVKI